LREYIKNTDGKKQISAKGNKNIKGWNISKTKAVQDCSFWIVPAKKGIP
jgi:hypothetical protein